MAKEGGLGGPGGRGRGRWGKEEDRCFLGDMPTARGTVQGGQGLGGAGVLEVSSDPSS